MIKQSVGIDISKDSFTACICSSQNLHHRFSEVRKFKNSKTGFNQLAKWVAKNSDGSQLSFLMEATGVYHENLAHHLYKIKKRVHVVLPNKSNHFFKSLNIKTKTDALDAIVLSQFGAERIHKEWTPPSPVFKQIRELTRFYIQLREQRTALKNIKHSKEEAFEVSTLIIRSNTKLIKSFEAQMQVCLKDLERIINLDPELKQKIENVCTIKGVQLLSAAIVLAETNGFEGFENRKQVTSYAGYDIVHNESGTSVRGKTRISKKGNKYIRQALYMPAMVACRYNPEFRRMYLRLVEKKPSKMIGQVAIQRKLLLLMYTLWTTNNEYVPKYHDKKIAQQKSQTIQDSMIEQLP